MGSEDRDQIQLMLQVAHWYYEDEVSQEEIGRRIGYSRSVVSRMLSEARRRRIVRFVIGHPLERSMRLESALTSRYGISDARVADTGTAPGALIVAAAELLTEVCVNGSVIGVSNGNTISAVVAEMPTLHRSDSLVVQLIGTLGKDNPLVDSPDIARRLAERFGCPYRLMPAPLMVGSERMATALRREESVRNALMLGSHADVVLVGVGAFSEAGSGSIFAGLQDEETVAALVRHGAVGHIFGHHFTAAGEHIRDDWCGRVMAVPLEGLAHVRTVVGVAHGRDKAVAIRAALRGGYLDVLVTDTVTAELLLA